MRRSAPGDGTSRQPLCGKKILQSMRPPKTMQPLQSLWCRWQGTTCHAPWRISAVNEEIEVLAESAAQEGYDFHGMALDQSQSVIKLNWVMVIVGILGGIFLGLLMAWRIVNPTVRITNTLRALSANQRDVVTYVSTWAGFVYVAFVIDTFARRIVGWRASRTAHADFVLDAL